MAAVLTVLLILVGLPLLAWWFGSLRAWSRIDARGREEVQQQRDWMTRHALGQADVAAVDRAIGRGKQVEEPRLRAATVERARMVQEALRAWEERRSRLATAARWLQALFLLLLVATAVFAVSRGEWPSGLPFWLLTVAGPLVAQYLRRRNLARAIELNGGPDAA